MQSSLAWADKAGRFDLDFENIQVKTLLHKISEFADKNIILSPEIKGQMTLHLKQVTWQQALKAVVTAQHLQMHRDNQVVYIQGASDKSDGKSQPSYRTRVISLNYAQAKHLKQLLSHRVDHSSQLSHITADQHTNSLLVTGSKDAIARIRRLIDKLDEASPQVMVNARIVSIDQNYRQKLGVRFGLKGVKPFKQTSDTSQSSANTGLHVDLPSVATASSSAGLAMFKVAKGVLIDTELSALATEGHANIMSNPRLVASNHKPAEIEAGRKIPFQEKTGEGSTTATFKKAVLKLKVTPKVVHGDQLLLHLTVSQDSQGSERVLGVPTINTRQISTNVLVNNQRTIVLGGIYEHTKQHNTQKVPFLSALPLLGHLFQFHSKQNRKRQLMIFVTPKLLKS